MKRDRGRTCKTYHDGVDFKIHNRPNAVLVRKSQWEGLPYDPVYFCHKHKCAGVRYGVTSCIQTGEVVDAVGPFPCGKWPDVNILKKYVLPLLEDNEMIEADRGYRNSKCRNPEDFFAKSEKVAKRNVAAQHETINGRLVQWRSLYHMFRHSHHEHKYFFFTAVIIDNLNYQKYGPTFAKSY